ncbi:MAG: DNA topoisomerase VI subunit A [Synergistetes bacterium ADurb.BinA166]|nr:MAG: DNA topoisomerase VI subunit A [Synergistetes bacterium ADurb.BinA166]
MCVKSYRAKRKHERDQRAAERVREELTRQHYSEPEKWTVREAVLAVIPEASEKASEGGTVEFPQRNLFYVVRDLLQRYDVEWGRTKEGRLEYPNFTSILREYEETRGGVPFMYQDPRGTFIEPHTGEAFPVGTREVDGYECPSWTFNAVLYVEKEGFNPKLQQVKLAERYDLAILSGKGFSTRAGKRLLAKLAAEGCKLAVVHDCDLAGYEIARTLQAEARGCKALEVVDLGLTWEDAQGQGLQSEEYTLAKRPPEAFVQRARQGDVSEEAFRWLTGRDLGHESFWSARKVTAQRFELNAFSLSDFVTWLEAKLQEHGFAEKVVPPADVVAEKARGVLRREAERLVENALRSVVDERAIVAAEAKTIAEGVELVTDEKLREALAGNPATSWRGVLEGKQYAAVDKAVDREALKTRLRERLKAVAT